jgi:glycosyltransferase involved in cell wall biosynthesis
MSGGGIRAIRSLKEYTKHFNTYLLLPWGIWYDKVLCLELSNTLEMLKREGVKLGGFCKRSSFRLWHPIQLEIPIHYECKIKNDDYSIIVVLHEVWNAVVTGYTLSKYFKVPSIALLQLPPFYNRRRYERIVNALMLYREITKENGKFIIFEDLTNRINHEVGSVGHRLRYERVLRCYDLVVGVSRAVAVDMGGEWVDRMYCFDPGVSLDDEDLELIKGVRARVKEKQDYIVFGGRPVAEKGLAEALIAFKFISKRFPSLKLVLTGRIPPKSYVRVKRVLRRLGIEDKVVFTGFVSREKRFEIVAKAKLMLYPSHVDSFSYAVLESLHLGTSVVGYRIPALEIYYGKSPGVILVEEGDIEALTVKAIDALEKGVEAVEPPKIKSRREVMNEEIEMIKRRLS